MRQILRASAELQERLRQWAVSPEVVSVAKRASEVQQAMQRWILGDSEPLKFVAEEASLQ